MIITMLLNSLYRIHLLFLSYSLDGDSTFHPMPFLALQCASSRSVFAKKIQFTVIHVNKLFGDFFDVNFVHLLFVDLSKHGVVQVIASSL